MFNRSYPIFSPFLKNIYFIRKLLSYSSKSLQLDPDYSKFYYINKFLSWQKILLKIPLKSLVMP